MKPEKNPLTAAMDDFALQIMNEAKVAENLPDKVTAFKEIGRWVAIKYKIDPEGDGEGIDDLKSKLKSANADRADRPIAPAAALLAPGVGNAKRALLDGDGSGLDEIRARIPGRGNGSDDGSVHGAGDDPGGQIPFGVRARGRRLFGPPGGAESDASGSGGGGDV